MPQQREKRDNSGILFVNDRKEKDTHPDRNGSATIDGVDYWVSGWNKQDRNGDAMVSLSFKRKEAPNRFQKPEPQRGLRSMEARHPQDDPDDPLPF